MPHALNTRTSGLAVTIMERKTRSISSRDALTSRLKRLEPRLGGVEPTLLGVAGGGDDLAVKVGVVSRRLSQRCVLSRLLRTCASSRGHGAHFARLLEVEWGERLEHLLSAARNRRIASAFPVCGRPHALAGASGAGDGAPRAGDAERGVEGGEAAEGYAIVRQTEKAPLAW